MQRHFALAVPLCPGDVGTTKAAGTANPNSFRAKIHGRLQGPLHGAAETDPTLELDRHVLSHKLGIEFRRAHLDNVDLDLGAATDLRNVIRHSLDLRALPADHETGAGGMQSHANAVPGALHDDLGKSGKLKATTEILTHPEVFVQLLLVVFAFGIPLGAPITIDDESETDGIYFLSHNSLC